MLENEGKPIWDGVQEVKVREASPIEYNRWQASRNKAHESGNDVGEGVTTHMVYLIDIQYPTDN